MLNSNKEIKQTIGFINSMVIKYHPMAVSMNKTLSEYYDVKYDSDDLTTWPYYLNLSGSPHSANGNIYINRIGDNKTILLTKNSLRGEYETHKELLKFDSYYNELLGKYPGEELYIRGIISDISMDDLVNAVDGEILFHNKDYLEYNEDNIIPYLNSLSKNFIARWDIPLYVYTDNLYASAFYSSLIAFIFKKFIIKRFHNIKEYNIDQRYQYLTASSFMDVGKYIDILNNQSRLWLIKNLPYLSYNVGKDTTFNTLIKNVLEPSGFTVNEIDIFPVTPILYKDKVRRVDNAIFEVNKDRLEVLNNRHLKDIIYKSDSSVSTFDYYRESGREFIKIEEALSSNVKQEERSKFYLIKSKFNLSIISILGLDTILEIIIIDLLTHPEEKVYFKNKDMSKMDLFIILIYSLQAIYKIDLKRVIYTFRPSKIYSSPIDKTLLFNKIKDKENILHDLINKIIPFTSELGSRSPKETIEDNLKIQEILLTCFKNVNDWFVESELEKMEICLRDANAIPVDLGNRTVEEYMEEICLKDTINDKMALLYDIIYFLTGYDVSNMQLMTLYKKLKGLITALTSYTVTPILDIGITDVVSRGRNLSIISAPDRKDNLNIMKLFDGEVACDIMPKITAYEANDDKIKLVQVNKKHVVMETKDFDIPKVLVQQVPNDEVVRIRPSLIVRTYDNMPIPPEKNKTAEIECDPIL